MEKGKENQGEGPPRALADTLRDLRDLMYFLSGEHNAEKVQKAELRVKEAEEKGDLKLLFRALYYLVTAATHGRFPDKAIAAFTRRLAMCKRYPEQFAEKELLWEYKWIVPKLANLPTISRAMIDETCERMASCYRRHGIGLRPVYGIHAELSLILGEPERAAEWLARRDETARDDNCDCPACELNGALDVLAAQERDAEVYERAQPLLDGRVKLCEGNGPCHTLATLLLPCLRQRRLEAAARFHQWGYPLMEGKRKYLSEISEHLMYLALTGDLTHALRAFELHLPIAVECSDKREQWSFYRAASVLMRQVLAAGHGPLAMTLPAGVPAPAAAGQVATEALTQWLTGQALDLARAYDERNGNRYYQQQLEADRSSSGSLPA